jgi:hypothetical protein
LQFLNEEAKNQLEADITANKKELFKAEKKYKEALRSIPFNSIAVIEYEDEVKGFTSVVERLEKMRELF